VQRALADRGLVCGVRELPSSTRTAADAAASIGCAIGQIVKSLVFVGATTGDPILALVSGQNRVDEHALARAAGQSVRKARADEVRRHTGFAIGGVPPIGHASRLTTFIDRDLLAFDEVWAAAGTPHAVFAISASALGQATGGQVIDLAEAR
jgi:prolyl-tRNA editing enzyme YbaK/EbsC (Cys-tRNA(Pro) deacylase)